MISTTLICIATILGTNIFKAYIKSNNDTDKTSECHPSIDEDSEEYDKYDNVSFSLERFEITAFEKNIYESLKKELSNLKNVDDVDTKLKNFNTIASTIARCYKNAAFPLPKIGRPTSVKMMKVLNCRFKDYVNNENLSNLFDKIKFYIEFCLREYVDSQNDQIFHYLLDHVREGGFYVNDTDCDVVHKYSEDFEGLFIPIILSKENKRKNYAIENKYQKPLSNDTEIYTYNHLLDYSGKLYNKVIDFYKGYGIYIGNDTYNHDVVYEIAKTILTISDFYFTHGMSVSNLAHDITNHNINYLHHEQPDALDEESEEDFLNRIIQNYFSGRIIKNYYYFLIMCSRAYHSLEKNWKSKERKLFTDVSDEKEFERIALNLVYNRVKDMEFPFLDGLSEAEIKIHILKTNPEP